MTHKQALDRLLIGNRRYASMRQLHPRQTVIDRQTLVDGQYPFAAIVSCSDSRVPSELIFDQGLGDLFIVRTAGHTINDLVLASIEYAVIVLHVPLVMVVGHAHCGAVGAVMGGGVLPGHLAELANCIRPALEEVDLSAHDALDRGIRANTRHTAARLLSQSQILADAVAANGALIVPAYYDLNTGEVELLG
jgi:carbonic anhydrase